jgi:hypothetical protein
MIKASPIPMIGDINGASSIAPIITAGELVIRPRVAMLHERMTSKKKSNPGDAKGVISLIISLRSAEDRG